jgi:hypothetical protein
LVSFWLLLSLLVVVVLNESVVFLFFSLTFET